MSFLILQNIYRVVNIFILFSFQFLVQFVKVSKYLSCLEILSDSTSLLLFLFPDFYVSMQNCFFLAVLFSTTHCVLPQNCTKIFHFLSKKNAIKVFFLISLNFQQRLVKNLLYAYVLWTLPGPSVNIKPYSPIILELTLG